MSVTIKPGEKYRLRVPYGNQTFDPVGLRHGLAAGAVGTVRELVGASTVGAHNMEEDAVVLEFDDEARTIGSDGEVVIAPQTRAVSFSLGEFEGQDALFEKVKS